MFVEPAKLREGWDRDRILKQIATHGIPGLSGSCPRDLSGKRHFLVPDLAAEDRLPVARELGETSIQLLVHPTLQDADMQAMVAAIANVLREAQDS